MSVLHVIANNAAREYIDPRTVGEDCKGFDLSRCPRSVAAVCYALRFHWRDHSCEVVSDAIDDDRYHVMTARAKSHNEVELSDECIAKSLKVFGGKPEDIYEDVTLEVLAEIEEEEWELMREGAKRLVRK